MDPLCITASIVTLLGTTRLVGKGLGKLIRICGVPNVLSALNNEVLDLEILVVNHRESLSLASLCLQSIGRSYRAGSTVQRFIDATYEP